jgi:cytochrome c-type biogenesis protein CcmH
MSGLSRRGFLARLGAAVVLPIQGPAVQDSLAGRGDVGTLRDPTAAGRPRAPTEFADYDERIKAIEHRLACTCGCTLDIFTCRTTDFSCTYSPRLHREVVELDRAGKTAQQILDTFVAKYGEKALMAPKPEGFNLWGYLLPGSAILVAGGALVAFVSRRRIAVAGEAAAGSTAPGVAADPESDGRAHAGAPAPAASASPAELERLRKALAEVED